VTTPGMAADMVHASLASLTVNGFSRSSKITIEIPATVSVPGRSNDLTLSRAALEALCVVRGTLTCLSSCPAHLVDFFFARAFLFSLSWPNDAY